MLRLLFLKIAKFQLLNYDSMKQFDTELPSTFETHCNGSVGAVFKKYFVKGSVATPFRCGGSVGSLTIVLRPYVS